MAAASVRRRLRATTTFEDYSVYGHLSDKDLIQLATERSLTEAHGPSQPVHQFACSPLTQTQATVLAQEDRSNVNDPNTTNSECEETVRQPCFSDNREMLRTLRCRKMSMDSTDTFMGVVSELKSAILKNDDTTVSSIVWSVSAESLSEPDSDGWIHLHMAAFAGSLKCLEVLVKAFPQLINKCTVKNQTPLILAAGRKHLSCAQCLLAAGADPNIANYLGKTALYKACEKDNEEMVALILEAGGSASRGTPEGVTPLHEAVGSKNFSMCKLLVEAGAKIRAKNVYGIEPVFTAAQIGDAELVNYLIRHGGNVNSQTNDGATALYEASKNGHEEVVKSLLSRGVDANQTNRMGLTALHVAAKNGHAGVVSFLISRTYRAVVRESGISPLHLAAEHNRDAVLKIFIETGYDVNTQLSLDHSLMYEDRRSTALYFTVCNSNMVGASMLLEGGADPNLDVFNPLLIAVRKGNIDMASLLVRHGANVNASMLTQPTTFPGAFLFCMKDRDMFKLLLDNAADANSCFYCVYGNNIHPPISKSIHPSGLDLHMHDHEAPTETAQVRETEIFGKI